MSQETFSLQLSFSRFSRILSLCGNHDIGILKDKGIHVVNIEGSVELVYNFAKMKNKRIDTLEQIYNTGTISVSLFFYFFFFIIGKWVRHSRSSTRSH